MEIFEMNQIYNIMGKGEYTVISDSEKIILASPYDSSIINSRLGSLYLLPSRLVGDEE